jgi:hypothetical protein
LKPLYSEVKFARECGILNDGQAFAIDMLPGQEMIIHFGNNGALRAKTAYQRSFQLSHLPLTVVGRELYNLIKPDSVFEDIIDAGQAFFGTGMFEFVQVQTNAISANGDITILENKYFPENYIES